MGFPILPVQKYRALHTFFLFLLYKPFNSLQEKNYIDQKEAHISHLPCSKADHKLFPLL